MNYGAWMELIFYEPIVLKYSNQVAIIILSGYNSVKTPGPAWLPGAVVMGTLATAGHTGDDDC